MLITNENGTLLNSLFVDFIRAGHIYISTYMSLIKYIRVHNTHNTHFI